MSIPPERLAVMATRLTSLIPGEAGFISAIEGFDGSESWDDVYMMLLATVIESEVEKRYPGLEKEWARNHNEWDSRTHSLRFQRRISNL